MAKNSLDHHGIAETEIKLIGQQSGALRQRHELEPARSLIDWDMALGPGMPEDLIATLAFARGLPSVSQDFPAVFDLSTLNGSNGFRLDGIDDANGRSGSSVASAGDVNGDGFDDILVGAYHASSSGQSYVVFGKAGGFAASLSLANLTGANGFRIDGIDERDNSGQSVSGAGDVNGDGFDDIIIGSRYADPGGDQSAGESYIVFGRAGGFAASLSLASLNGANGFRIDGIDVGDFSGGSVSGAGDVNGDGFDDIIIGAISADPGSSRAGESYVVFGKAGGFAASLSLAGLDGANGFRIDGIDADDFSGGSISSAGDVNGDGLADIIIGAGGGDRGFYENAGESYVVFGKAGGFAASLDLAGLDGANGFRIDGIDAGDLASTVSSAGDVNGDGFDDIIIGAQRGDPGGDSDAGESYVVFGKVGSFTATLSLAGLDGANGFRIDGIDAGDFSGVSISGAGDVNGDGFADILIGADLADPGGDLSAGESYVVFGKAGGFAASLSLASLTGANGFRIDGVDAYDQSGDWVSSAGDVNGDGFSDIIVGALLADPGGIDEAGESYVVFGRAPGSAVNRLGSAADQHILGGAFDDTLRGAAGDDTLGGAGGADFLNGGEGGDWADYSQAARRVTADLQIPANNTQEADGDSYVSIENLRGGVLADNLRGDGGANRLEGGVRNDRLSGRAGDDTLVGGAGADALNGGSGIDWADYSGANRRVIADLQIPANNTREAAGDSYVSIENLRGGALADNLRGDGGANRIEGGGRNDRLSGRAGDDTLVGGQGFDQIAGQQGRDSFLLASADPADYDRIVDFAANETILLDGAVFGLAPGALDPDAFVLGNGARDGEDRLIYLQSVGKLFFDPDGAGGAERELIAIIENRPELDAGHFVVI